MKPDEEMKKTAEENAETSEKKSPKAKYGSSKEAIKAGFEKFKKSFKEFCSTLRVKLGEGFKAVVEWISGKRGAPSDHWALVICLLLSVSVWLYVVNINSAGFEKGWEVTIQTEGGSSLGSQNMSVVNGYGQRVQLTLKGKRGDIDRINRDDLHVYIDLGAIDKPGRHTLPVMIDLPKNTTLVSVIPSEVVVSVDKNVSKTVGIKVNIDRILDAAYVMLDPVPDHKEVTVKGPASVLDSISHAAVYFDVGKIDGSLTAVGSLLLYDLNGIVVSNPYVKCDIDHVSVTIPVETTKIVPLKERYTGGVGANYEVSFVPDRLEVKGDPALLDKLDELVVYDINDGEYELGKCYERTFKVKLPDGVRLADPSKDHVTIRVERFF